MKYIIFFVFLAISLPSYSAERVRGYTKKNGTYVMPSYRTKSDSFKMNNYSTKGNSNPFTGKKGYSPSFKTPKTYKLK